tara:strand:+ start:1075 stop:1743 length:669 start_codon:yes stop_codon:yes gene_type:complete
MKIAITGASGKTGYRVAEEALSSGYDVRLIVRSQSEIPDSIKRCETYVLSEANGITLDYALKDCESLVIATGARPSIDLTGPAKVDYLNIVKQVESCKRQKLKRVILVSSLCAGKLIHPLNLFGLILIWKRLGEQSLQKSGLDWTVIRPGGLNENEANLKNQNILFSAEKTQEEGSIPRRLVAKSCIEALKTKDSIKKIIEITSSEENTNINMSKAIKKFNI